MFRSYRTLFSRRVARNGVLKRLSGVPKIEVRLFTNSSYALGKKKKSRKGGNKKGEQQQEENEPTEEIDTRQILKQADNEFQKSIEEYGKRATQVKMGKADPDIFNSLEIALTNKRRANFQQVAQTTMKGGKFLTVTVFDPNDTKSVISAILGTNLNLNPEVDSKNSQLLKVLLPNSTKELKTKQLKELKELTDDFKTAHNNKFSLVHLRGKYMKLIKNVEGSEDVVRKVENDIEKLYKNYASKLSDAYKASERSLR
ncbi:hypothetical protein FOA43_000461 [Brettanomyces nanus]|uniref:Ribosome-recycling factor, mitochondrial n=1 Tax=Eeniella nana TaxID=13502 RepID=A0A875RYM4_EENNA|nr:uncharacterized protein FOA43_000461 [Brettanomyces nanus]QPG73155.1 hypothetical protein FOA43_000461 [Brettanomyces nanus]